MLVTKSLPLDSDHFNFDLTEGFEMAVEKDWNVLDFADLNDQLPIYDADLRELNPDKYAVRIFYKACIPMNYVDPVTYATNPLIKNANNPSFVGKYLDLIDGTVIGSPVNKMSEGSTSEQSYGEFGYHGLLIADDVPSTHEAYALPDDRQLNHTNVAKWAFAAGSSLATCRVSDTDTYLQPYDWDASGFAYMLMNKGGYNDGGVASFIVNNGALAYSIDTSANRFNLPTDDHHQNAIKYLQPLLFKPFGVAFADHLTIHEGTEVATAGWFYCVLGVQEISGEDPSYQIDPSVTHVQFKNGSQLVTSIEMQHGVYSGYEASASTECDTLVVEVADYVELVEAGFNGSTLTVGSPTDNKYTFSISMIEGTNTLTLRTMDENGQSLNYICDVSYEEDPPVTNPPFTSVRLADYNDDDKYEIINGVVGQYTYTDDMVEFDSIVGEYPKASINISFLQDAQCSNFELYIDGVLNSTQPSVTDFGASWTGLVLSSGQPSVIEVKFDDAEGHSVTITFGSATPPTPTNKPFRNVRLSDSNTPGSNVVITGANGQYTYTGNMVQFDTEVPPMANIDVNFTSEDDPCSNFELYIDSVAVSDQPTVTEYAASWNDVHLPSGSQPSVIEVRFEDSEGHNVTVTFGSATPPTPTNKPFNTITLADLNDRSNNVVITGVSGQYTYTGNMVEIDRSAVEDPMAYLRIDFPDGGTGSNYKLLVDGEEPPVAPSEDIENVVYWDDIPAATQPSSIVVTFDDADGNAISATFSGGIDGSDEEEEGGNGGE